MVEVRADGDRYALKLYRPGVRTVDDVHWEVALHRHLLANRAPVAPIISGLSGVETVDVARVPHIAVLSSWAACAKPSPSEATYRLVGRAAAEIRHRASAAALSRPPSR